MKVKVIGGPCHGMTVKDVGALGHGDLIELREPQKLYSLALYDVSSPPQPHFQTHVYRICMFSYGEISDHYAFPQNMSVVEGMELFWEYATQNKRENKNEI